MGDIAGLADRRGFLRGGGLLFGGIAASGVPAIARAARLSTHDAFALVNLLELEARAERVIPKGAFDYIARGAGDEWTLAENRAAFQRLQIVPHIYGGAAGRDLSTKLLGSRLASPIITAPMGVQAIASPEAEVGTACGTAAAGALFAYSTMSTRTIEQVAAASPAGPRWFQLYQPDDDGLTRELLQRAKAAGYTAVIHTLDTIAPGNREANVRNRYAWSAAEAPGNFRNFTMRTVLGWKDLEFVQTASGLPVVPKGLISAGDADRAIRLGAAGLWLSNHGGRQLDGAPASLTVLPGVARRVAGRVPIIVDGGVRRGQDVFRALALGADAVAVGRPLLYALALGGSEAVQATLHHLAEELRAVMQHAGAATLKDIGPASLLPVSA